MAMKNALHMQASRRREAKDLNVAGAAHSSQHVHMAHEHHKVATEAKNAQEASSVKKEISQASSLAEGVAAAEKTGLQSLHIAKADDKQASSHMSLDALVAEKKKELAEVESTEVKEIDIVKKAELHKLAAIKKTDLGKERDLQKQIKDLEARSALEQEEKKIQDQISHVKQEEEQKLTALHKNLAKLEGTEIHEHKSISKPVVKVVKETKSKEEPSASTETASRESKKAAKPAKPTHQSSKKEAKPACTETDCDVDGEDKKWLVKGGSLNKYSRDAVEGSGKAKRVALEHMQKLKEQIEDDYKHVTDFAIAQENALSPPPSQN
ncbi:hypothetical protein GUITHDRAFT_133127 [Guillardia theta CCMP2712]|uniref:Uncharacterized protein n=2 Tax=Guillardia theta TaxID=55529 RepID=L1JYH1_GUITC|nr:hypothetical protein GUITHDRAFT_133127 [Guillardia theta CCMP2712]EKX53407.1 hypothetical protein GUITHDRAFT_133127 [Guillardia theta CCMP2712]|eukprot:XP_005840387.1 hypothetical protein GUITHDRAFT_133127 [Guillardia theta CCMP2712]